MEYLILFLEGIITFISPCLLPMLPIYVSYFAGTTDIAEKSKKKSLKNAIAFVLGFTVVFITLGAFAGTVGRFLKDYNTIFNLVSGIIVILFGLSFLNIIKIPFSGSGFRFRPISFRLGFFSSFLFGLIFSIGWTPCVGAFLGSALMLAAQSAESLKGILMLLCFSIGLGIPFIISAVLIDSLKSSFDFIKKHYKIINIISGIFLIIIGLLMATGYMGYFISLLIF